MSKKLKVVVISSVVCLILASSVVAFAVSSNVGTVENAWLEFQKVLNNERVANGDMTREEADEHQARSLEKFEESEEDVVYNRERKGGGKGGRQNGMVETYAQVLGIDGKEALEQLKDGDKTIWQLAEDAGKFEAMKSAVIADINEQIAKTEDSERLEKLNEHKAEITAMKTAADAPERPERGERGQRGNESKES